jgi:hypothetical protein
MRQFMRIFLKKGNPKRCFRCPKFYEIKFATERKQRLSLVPFFLRKKCDRREVKNFPSRIETGQDAPIFRRSEKWGAGMS